MRAIRGSTSSVAYASDMRSENSARTSYGEDAPSEDEPIGDPPREPPERPEEDADEEGEECIRSPLAAREPCDRDDDDDGHDERHRHHEHHADREDGRLLDDEIEVVEPVAEDRDGGRDGESQEEARHHEVEGDVVRQAASVGPGEHAGHDHRDRGQQDQGGRPREPPHLLPDLPARRAETDQNRDERQDAGHQESEDGDGSREVRDPLRSHGEGVRDDDDALVEFEPVRRQEGRSDRDRRARPEHPEDGPPAA